MNLDELREQLDKIDDQMLELLAKRFEVTKKVGVYKVSNNLPVVAPHREKEIFERLSKKAKVAGLDEEVARHIWRTIIDEVVIKHKQIREELK